MARTVSKSDFVPTLVQQTQICTYETFITITLHKLEYWGTRCCQYMLSNCMDSLFVNWILLLDWIFVHLLYDLVTWLYRFTLFGFNSSCELNESISLEMAPPQQCFPLKPAESICSPLIGPNPLQIEGVVAPSSCRGRPWANYLQPAQQKPRLGPDPHHR